MIYDSAATVLWYSSDSVSSKVFGGLGTLNPIWIRSHLPRASPSVERVSSLKVRRSRLLGHRNGPSLVSWMHRRGDCGL